MRLNRIFSYEFALVLILGFAFGIMAFDSSAIGILMPYIVDELRLSPAQVGLVTGAPAIILAITNFLGGWGSDVSGRRKPWLIGSIIAFSLCSVGSGLVGSFVALLAARLLMGAVQGPGAPITMVLIAEGSTPARRGLNGGLVGSCAPLFGAVLAPVLLVTLADRFGWRNAFFIVGIPGLVVAAVIALAVREGSARVAPVQRPESRPTASLRMRDVILARNIWVCGLCSCCLAGFSGALGVLLSVYLVQTRHLTPATMGALLSAAGAGTLISGNVLLALADRIGHKRLAVSVGFGSMAAPLGVLFGADSLPVLGIALWIGFTATATIPLLFMLIPAASLPSKVLGTAMGFVTSLATLVGGGASIIAGWVAGFAGPAAPYWIAVGISLVWGSVALLLRENRKA